MQHLEAIRAVAVAVELEGRLDHVALRALLLRDGAALRLDGRRTVRSLRALHLDLCARCFLGFRM